MLITPYLKTTLTPICQSLKIFHERLNDAYRVMTETNESSKLLLEL